MRFIGMNDSVVWNIVRSEGETIPIKVERSGQILDFFGRPLQSRNPRLATEERASNLDLTRNHAIGRQGATEDAGGGSWFAKRGHHPRL